MDRIFMWVMGICALIGALDRILGNRLKLGQKFEYAFELMGPTALSMVGLLCFVPLISRWIQNTLIAVCEPLSLDPSIFGGILAIDMGGYQLSIDLALEPCLGNFSGIVIASIVGCTICFTIPVGTGILNKDARLDFAHGILLGFASIPVALIIGGMLCGIKFQFIFSQSLPYLILILLIILGMWRLPLQTIRLFSLLGSFLKFLSTLGLALGAFEYMTSYPLLPELAPIEDAMSVVASIAIVMLGSLTFAELLQRLLKRPLERFGKIIHISNTSVTGLLIGMVSVLPAIALMNDMDKRGRILNGAFMVCVASTFAAHLSFVVSVDASQILPLLCSKLCGGFCGIAIALFALRNTES